MGSCLGCRDEEFGFVPAGLGRPFAVKSGKLLGRTRKPQALAQGLSAHRGMVLWTGGTSGRKDCLRTRHGQGWGRWWEKIPATEDRQWKAPKQAGCIRQQKECVFGT